MLIFTVTCATKQTARFFKTFARRHFCNEHPEVGIACREWHVVKDGDVIRTNRTDKPLTELTLTLTSVSSVTQEQGDDAEGEDE